MQQQKEQASSKIFGYTILFIGFVIITGGSWLLYSEYKRQQQNPMPGPGGEATPVTVSSVLSGAVKTATGNPTSSANTKFPLSQGSRGPEIKAVQKYLNSHYNAGLDEDGIWGSKTNAALLKYEKTTSVSKAEFDKMTSNATAVNTAAGHSSES